MRAEPEWSSLPANLHWRLREVLERCLKKELKDRCHDTSDVRVDIQKVPADPSGLMVQSLGKGEPKELFDGGNARYLPTGHIVYTAGNSLLGARFDATKLEVSGGSIPLVEDVLRINGNTQYAISDSGTLIYIPETTGSTAPGRTLVWVNREGGVEPLEAPPAMYYFPNISPDGNKVAMQSWRAE